MEKRLFTPGPLTTSDTVKQAMVRDLGSRDFEFIEAVEEIREGLLSAAGLTSADGYSTVIIQGSGTFGIESVITSVVPYDGKILIIINGSYGRRMANITRIHGIDYTELTYPENESPRLTDVIKVLENDSGITHVAMVHCETTTGIFNELTEIGHYVSTHGKVFIVDAMSSFGAVPVNLPECGISFLISSSNKCIEGVPGFSFVIGKKGLILESEGQSRTLSLDLYSQWKGLEADGQFRFTPPVQVLLAFRQALAELEAEGGPEGRSARYARNHRVLIDGMTSLGFETYLTEENQGYIITTFHNPADPAFDFSVFYEKLNERGYVIYPGKLTDANTFRIGTIGQLDAEDIFDLVGSISDIIEEMGIRHCGVS